MIGSNQAVKAARAAKMRPVNDGHDSLHLYRPDEPNYQNTGLKHCWCMCQRCFQRYQPSANGRNLGRCICPNCPCYTRFML